MDARLAVKAPLETVQIVPGGAQSSIKPKIIIWKAFKCTILASAWVPYCTERFHCPHTVSVEEIADILWRCWDCRWTENKHLMEQLLFLTPGCSFAAVITLFPPIFLHWLTRTDIPMFVAALLLLSTPPPCVLTILPKDLTSIHVGPQSPLTDNRLYLEVLFWVVLCSVWAHVCMYAGRETPYPFPCQFTQHRSSRVQPKEYRVVYVYSIDYHNNQCNTSIFDLYPLVSELSGCSLIEFFSHWLSKWEAGRQSITVQVTWPTFWDVLY